MTDQERKVMEMALEALQVMKAGQHAEEKAYMDKVIEALRQALAQDEQEPVIDRRLKVKIGRQYGYALNEHWFYLQPADEYAEQALTKHSGISAPPSKPWVSLTDEEADILIMLHAPPIHPDFNDDDDFIELVNAIEAALKEKNA